MTTQPRRSTRRDTKLATEPVSAIIVDLDNTIADAYWRDPLRGNWEEYYEASIRDEPFPWIVDLLVLLHDTGLYNIVCVTGRPERWRTLSMKWLLTKFVPIDELLMRSDDDRRPAMEVKETLVKARFPTLSQVAFVLEDRADACEFYRMMGLNVLQVHKGVPEATP